MISPFNGLGKRGVNKTISRAKSIGTLKRTYPSATYSFLESPFQYLTRKIPSAKLLRDLINGFPTKVLSLTL